MKKNQKSNPKVVMIYNPAAGKKRKRLPFQSNLTLKEIKELLEQYQIVAEAIPTKYPGHATELAQQCVKDGCSMVISAGGDGTLGEILTGLIGSEVTLAILPLGSFMNVARMLSIPRDIEAAIMLMKIGKTRKIDVGMITELSGKKSKQYFLEETGLGIEAEVHNLLVGIFEQNDYSNIIELIKIFFRFYGRSARVYLDDTLIETRATMVSIANAPYTGASLHLAPKARLNDHRLTVSLYKMNKWEITKYLFGLLMRGKGQYHPKIQTFQATRVRIETKKKRLVHADARVFGYTPVQYEVIPNAVKIIAGFPKKSNTLLPRSPLDP